MTTTLRARAAAYLRDAATGIRRAPVEVLATLATAIAFSVAIEIGDDTMRSWAETAVAALLILALAWTGTLLHALGAWSERRRWSLTLVGAVVVALYALTVQDFSFEGEAWRAVLLVAAAFFWLLTIAAFGGAAADRVERMRGIDGRIVLRIIGAGLYCAALFAGLALALRAVDVLFELSLDDEIYGHVFGWIFFVLAPWIVLGGLPDYVRPLGQANPVAGVAQRIALFLVPPLLGIYFLILYAYVVRIVITGEIPKNLVSPLVLASGALTILALLLFDPRADGRPLSRALRMAAPIFLPLAPLGAYALLVRLDQYGQTEFRVIRLAVLAVMLVLAIGATLRVLRRKPMPLHVATLALAVTGFALAIGPWSALALSRRSQQDRLERALTEVGIDPTDESYRAPAGADTMPRVVPTRVYEAIRGSAQYLAGHFGPDALPPALWHLAERDDSRWLEYAAELGFRPDSVPEGERYARGGTLANNTAVAIRGGVAYRVYWPGRGVPQVAPGGDRSIVTTVDRMRFSLRIVDRVVSADLTALVGRMDDGPTRPVYVPPAHAVAPLIDSAGTTVGELIVTAVWTHPDSTGWTIGSLEGVALIRE